MAESGDAQNEAWRQALSKAMERRDTKLVSEIRREILSRSEALVKFQQDEEEKRRGQDSYAALARKPREVENLQNAERQAQDLESILHPSVGGKTPEMVHRLEDESSEGEGGSSEGESGEEAGLSEEGSVGSDEGEGEESGEEAGSGEEESVGSEEEEGEGEYPTEYQVGVDHVLRSLATLRKKTVETVNSATAQQRAAMNLIQYIATPEFARNFGERPQKDLLAHVTTYEDAARAHVNGITTAEELAKEAEEQARHAFVVSTVWADATRHGCDDVYEDVLNLRDSPPDADTDDDDQ